VCAGGGLAVELAVIFFYKITREAIFSSAAYIAGYVAGCGCRVSCRVSCRLCYGVATISRLLKIIGLFCRI